MISPFYILENGLYHPQTPATGWWNRAHQNGVAVGGLLILIVENEPKTVPMLTCRLTIDIMRAVSFGPLETRCRVIKSSAKLQMLESQILVGGEVVARAGALRVRIEDTPPGTAEPGLLYPAPEQTSAVPVTSALSAGHPMETRVVMGSPREAGPGIYWTRINAQVVEGQPVPALARAAMAADIASAPSSVLNNREWSYANIDLSVYFTRPPAGEWVLTESETVTAGNGLALVNSILADREGPFGRAHQTLFVAPRAKKTPDDKMDKDHRPSPSGRDVAHGGESRLTGSGL
jgi:acyl-coenzyme A thioesterase PaaI-like protein